MFNKIKQEVQQWQARREGRAYLKRCNALVAGLYHRARSDSFLDGLMFPCSYAQREILREMPLALLVQCMARLPALTSDDVDYFLSITMDVGPYSGYDLEGVYVADMVKNCMQITGTNWKLFP